MKGATSSCVLLTLLLLSFSCKKKENSVTDATFRYYNLEKQGWKSKMHAQEIEGITFTATEVPISYYLLKEMGKEKIDKVDSLYEVNKRERIIEFTFQEEKDQDVLKEEFTGRDYKKSVEYLSFTIQKDFYAVTAKRDTLDCQGVLFERNFKISPQTRILLFFSGVDPNEKIQLVYQDNLFRKGTIKFNFQELIINL